MIATASVIAIPTVSDWLIYDAYSRDMSYSFTCTAACEEFALFTAAWRS
jgi:hypothetical protein